MDLGLILIRHQPVEAAYLGAVGTIATHRIGRPWKFLGDPAERAVVASPACEIDGGRAIKQGQGAEQPSGRREISVEAFRSKGMQCRLEGGRHGMPDQRGEYLVQQRSRR